MRRMWLASIIGGVVLAGVGANARADTVLLGNGDHLVGELQLPDLSMVTESGVVRVEPGGIWRVTLEGVDGDVIELRDGGSLTGLLDHPTYTIRLSSGQRVVVRRSRVSQLVLRPR